MYQKSIEMYPDNFKNRRLIEKKKKKSGEWTHMHCDQIYL